MTVDIGQTWYDEQDEITIKVNSLVTKINKNKQIKKETIEFVKCSVITPKSERKYIYTNNSIEYKITEFIDGFLKFKSRGI